MHSFFRVDTQSLYLHSKSVNLEKNLVSFFSNFLARKLELLEEKGKWPFKQKGSPSFSVNKVSISRSLPHNHSFSHY